jgi:tRNA A-37 threonylcarbamoyl transferase component Bud32
VNRPLDSIPAKPLAKGRTAEVFDLGDGTVVKLLREGFDPSMIETEGAKTSAAHDAGVSTPSVHGFVNHDGRAGAIFDLIEGDLLLDEAVTQPLRLRRWGKTLGDIHADMLTHSSADLPSLREVLAEKIDATDLTGPQKAAAKERLTTLPDATNVLHGDFHPGNVILSNDGPVLIDWIDASRGAPAADITRTLWLLSPATIPDNVPGRRFRTTVQSIFRRAYRTKAMRGAGVSPLEIDLWRLPVAAARLSEGIEHEDTALRSEVHRLTNS